MARPQLEQQQAERLHARFGIERDELVQQPFTTKAQLRDAYPFGMLKVPLTECIRIHASSGTRGKATIVAYTQNDIALWADCCARALAAAGAARGTVVHVAYGYGLFTGGLGLHYGAERLGCTVIPASGGNTPRQAQLLEDLGADDTGAHVAFDLHRQLVEAMRPLDDELIVRLQPGDLEQHALDLAGEDVDAADHEHVVRASDDP